MFRKSSKNRVNSKVKTSIIRTFLLVAVLPILIISSISIYVLRNQLRTRYEEQTQIEARRISSILFDTTTAVYLAAEGMINNRNCKLLFGTESMTDEQQTMYDTIVSSMNTYHSNTAAISSIKLYTDNPHIPSGGSIISGVDFTSVSFQLPADDTVWNSWSTQTSTDTWSHENYELTLVRRIGIASQNYRAYMVITLDNNNLKNRLDQNTYRIICDVDHSESFYSSEPAWVRALMPLPDEDISGVMTYAGILANNGEKHLTAIRSFRMYNTDNVIYTSVSDPNALASIAQLTRTLVILMIFSSVIPLFVILSYAGFFSRRVNTLKQAMHQASSGDYDIIDTFQGDDELTDTFRDLKKTVDLIHRRESEYYETQIREQKLINQQQQMEYSVLASQINPHFLYNTLETIRMLSLSHGDREAANAIKLLGKSMRYVLDNTGTSFVPLSAELSYVKTYLSIQELRFSERVSDAIFIDPDLDPNQYRILPLLLQPIVENAITHGLEGMDSGGLVTIDVKLSENASGGKELVVRVSDNGCGMDSDTLESLLYRIQNRDPAEKRHVGLYNINRRLKLLYPNRALLTVVSAVGEGTCVTVTMPAENIV